jgi:hypothetical protein
MTFTIFVTVLLVTAKVEFSLLCSTVILLTWLPIILPAAAHSIAVAQQTSKHQVQVPSKPYVCADSSVTEFCLYDLADHDNGLGLCTQLHQQQGVIA